MTVDESVAGPRVHVPAQRHAPSLALLRPVDEAQAHPAPAKSAFLDFGITPFPTTASAARSVADLARRRPTGTAVFTCNVDHVVLMRKNPAFGAAYARADVVTADGAPVVLLAKALGLPIGSRITGADLVPELARIAATRGLSMALVGGSPASVALAAERLTADNPGLDVAVAYSPPMGFEIGGSDDTALVRRLRQVRPDIVVVCLGAPKQEMWIDAHRDELPGSVLLGAGAAVDFLSGHQRRAPLAFQRSGTEWLYRLATNFPRLWRRYLVQDSAFVLVAAREIVAHRRRATNRNSAVTP